MHSMNYLFIVEIEFWLPEVLIDGDDPEDNVEHDHDQDHDHLEYVCIQSRYFIDLFLLRTPKVLFSVILNVSFIPELE